MTKRAESINDLYEDPKAYGIPTFEEFSRDPEKWLGKSTEVFDTAEIGFLGRERKNVRRHKFEIEGYRCATLEEVEKVALSQGIPLRELDYRPQMIPLGGGKCDILVKFVSKEDREKREARGE